MYIRMGGKVLLTKSAVLEEKQAFILSLNYRKDENRSTEAGICPMGKVANAFRLERNSSLRKSNHSMVLNPFIRLILIHSI